MRSAICVLCVLSAAAAAQPVDMLFTECAAKVGADHAFDPLPDYPGMHGLMVGALTVGDFNNDGWPDIYALGGGNRPDSLLINTGGSFENQTAQWGLDIPHRGASAAVGDANNDGLADIYVVSYGDADTNPVNDSCRLLINRGGYFEDAAPVAGVASISAFTDGMSSVFGDIDNDGDLDLFVCAWFENSNGNRLFINTGNNADGVPIFIDATDSMGVSLMDVRGFTPRMADLNGDLLPELLITADFRTSRFLVNLGPGPDGLPRFSDVTVPAGVTADTNGMGADLGDLDNDGDLDWFITNIYSEFAGTTNTLYLNTGLDADINAPIFLQTASAAGVHDAGWGWGTAFGDFDNDGDLDLAATGGWFQYQPIPARLYDNITTPGKTPLFREIASQAGFSFIGLGRSLATLDFDRDGDLDLVMSSNDGPITLYRNDAETLNSWIMFDLDSSAHPCLPPEGRHARVEVDAGSVTRIRVLDGGPTYLGQSEMVIHLGLGDAAQADAVRVLWPDGTWQNFGPMPVNTRHTLTARHPADTNADGQIDLDDLNGFVAAFSAGDASADLNGDGLHDLADLVLFIHAMLGNPCLR